MNPACLSRPSARANISRSAFLLFVFLFFFAMRISIDICYVLKVKTYFCLSEHTPHLNESLRVCSKVYLLGCTDYTHTLSTSQLTRSASFQSQPAFTPRSLANVGPCGSRFKYLLVSLLVAQNECQSSGGSCCAVLCR